MTPTPDLKAAALAIVYLLRKKIEALELHNSGYVLASISKDELNSAVSLLERLQVAEDAAKDDKERLDWLDSQVLGYGFEDVHEGNTWAIEGPFNNIRAAIDEHRSTEESGRLTP